uniref:G_PROTEIN_RECEP_F1_2 domain-containing protein n=1 Tax=Steinernema glaseri TaxID=37863 RepID=A0A1I7Y516_9BILA
MSDMSTSTKQLFYWLTNMLNVVSIAVNFRTLVVIFFRKKSNAVTYGMVLSTVVVHLFYNISSTVYTNYMLFISQAKAWNHAAIFWSGSMMFCSSLSLVSLNICVVIDRILAIERPINYGIRYKRRWFTVTVGIVVVVFIANFIGYACAMLDKPTQVQHFNGVVDKDVIAAFYLAKSILCALNIPLTMLFVFRLRRFEKVVQSESRTMSESLKIANHIVLYQMAADIVVIILPTFATYTYNAIFNTTITTRVGSYPNTLYVLYTTFCAFLLVVKLKSPKSSIGISVT